MLAWLLRDHVARLESAGASCAATGGEADRLATELAGLREDHERVVRELDRGRTLADLGLLAAGMVHDFNNLLTVIAGHASVARLGEGAQREASLERILEATHRASELSRTLLRWVRHQAPQPEPVDLDPLVAEVLDLLAGSAPQGVRIVRQPAGGLPPVMADPIDVRRVVLNLVQNAWQAIGDAPGEVVVRTGRSDGRFREAWLEVADDGRGMSTDVSARVFEPFYSTRETGAGLGLTTVRQIVERLGGRIEVWSAPGRGARFRVSLPALGSPGVSGAA